METVTRELLLVVAICAAVTSVGIAVARCEALDEGLAALQEGYDTMALPKLEEALRVARVRAVGPDRDGSAHHLLARALEGLAIYRASQGDTAASVALLRDALAAMTIALARDGRSSAYQTTVGDLYGQLAAQSGVVGKMRYGRLASAAYARALALDPRNPLAHVGAGIGKLETPAMFGGSVVEALREFRTAQELDPGCAEAWIWEGIALRREGSIAPARQAFANALRANPRSAHAKRELAALDEDY